MRSRFELAISHILHVKRKTTSPPRLHVKRKTNLSPPPPPPRLHVKRKTTSPPPTACKTKNNPPQLHVKRKTTSLPPPTHPPTTTPHPHPPPPQHPPTPPNTTPPPTTHHHPNIVIHPDDIPDSKVHGANMGHTWGRQHPSGSHVGHMDLVIWDPAIPISHPDEILPIA